MSDITNLASKFGLKINENGDVVNLGAINTVTVDSLQAELTDLKAKYQKAVEDAEKYKSERDFIKEYLNPADLSFRYMIDAFKVLPVEKQDKLIALAKSLSELGEKE